MNAIHNTRLGNDSADSSETYSLIVSDPEAALKTSEDATSETVSQLLYGEEIIVLETVDEWLRVRGKIDGYEGYSHQRHFASELSARTHRVVNRATLLFSEPDIKSPVLLRLTFGSRVALMPDSYGTGEFLRTTTGHFIWKTHCQPIEHTIAADPIQIIRQHFMAAPYLWGGRSSDGLDCSGLVQLVASMVGVDLPRDSGDQEMALHEIVERNAVQPNDLIFWPGHVAWAIDANIVLHANATSMNVCEEPLEAVNARAGAPSSYRRLRRASK